MAKTKKNGGASEDMTLPPVFSRTFYAELGKAAKDGNISRAAFALKAVRFYATALKKRSSPSVKTLGATGAKDYAEMSRQVSKSWWSKLTPEEKTARAKKAIEARWGKKPKKSK